MSSMTVNDACVDIAKKFEEFLHHKVSWQDVLENIQDDINIISTNVYSIGYYDAENKKPNSPPEVTDWRWQIKINPYV